MKNIILRIVIWWATLFGTLLLVEYIDHKFTQAFSVLKLLLITLIGAIAIIVVMRLIDNRKTTE